MISSLIVKYKGALMMIFIIFFVSLGAYSLYLNFRLESTKTKLENKEKEYKELEDATTVAIEEMNKAMLLQTDISKEKTINQNEKIEMIKHSEKVKQEVIRRGDIKQDEKDNFIITNF
ncbi:hypothetical protein [Aliarcobacter lanthieri]|uniref:hypothetical protein n=1 Tax=Aliarcobacter lanthieri TaxID=1355374 RepID=UPI000479522C|nr:hypothetical protein [Aliarcobacter lanthieri]